MPLNMQRAFHPQMQVPIKIVSTVPGYYDDNNDYIVGRKKDRPAKAVILRGNRYSQFGQGISRDPTEGGERFPDYRTMLMKRRYGILTMDDKVIFRCITYDVLQKDDEEHFGFTAYILEKVSDRRDGGIHEARY